MQPNLKVKYGGLKMKFMKSGQKGFTLIELLVVIAILGTLAGVVVLNVIGFIGRGACEAGATEYHNIQTAQVAWAYDNATTEGGATGDYTNYLLTDPKGAWTNTDGIISGTYPGCDTTFPVAP
jgi:prepilin-type N-terminal cleavage/methylation domain-containing protein